MAKEVKPGNLPVSTEETPPAHLLIPGLSHVPRKTFPGSSFPWLSSSCLYGIAGQAKINISFLFLEKDDLQTQPDNISGHFHGRITPFPRGMGSPVPSQQQK